MENEEPGRLKSQVSVRALIEWVLRSGDINMSGTSGGGAEDLREGTRIHRMIQKEAGGAYESEVRLSFTADLGSLDLTVDGIADGVITGTADGDLTVVDEIKSVFTPPEQIDEHYEPLHWAQVLCYAYMLAVRDGLPGAAARLTYYHIGSGKRKYIQKEFAFAELETFFNDLLDKYRPWAEFEASHRESRNRTIAGLAFPFDTYRKGQREFAVEVYRCISAKKKLYAQAPTGTGKTISTLFPALKAMGEGKGAKIFYLTAKTVTRGVAEEAAAKMRDRGADLRALTLTSRDRICAREERICTPDRCPNARGHYDRVNGAILDILHNETVVTRPVLEEYCEKHLVCPFEFSLDVALWSDLIICDYNYVFDPRAYLRRFFDLGGDYTILIDEAHNLVDRAREMFSASLSKRAILDMRNKLKPIVPGAAKPLAEINKMFIGFRKQLEAAGTADLVIELPIEIYALMETFTDEIQIGFAEIPATPRDEKTMDLFFESLSFLAVYRAFDEKYTAYISRDDNDDIILKLFCADPSRMLAKACAKGRTSVFFSATLLPLDYYKDLLGGKEDDLTLLMPSPFPRDNLLLLVAGNVSTKYARRSESFGLVAEYIYEAVSRKTGNYLVFLPSFVYLRNIVSAFSERWPEMPTISQESFMHDEARGEYLARFVEAPEETLVAFAVAGGLFSEGIDLPGDRLSGAVVVGVGLPQLCFERDLIMAHFGGRDGNGFDYAYMFPGMNRVMQAAGRVIRSETDRGFVLLIDDRFTHRRYRDIFPPEWAGAKRTDSPARAGTAISAFYKEEER